MKKPKRPKAKSSLAVWESYNKKLDAYKKAKNAVKSAKAKKAKLIQSTKTKAQGL